MWQVWDQPSPNLQPPYTQVAYGNQAPAIPTFHTNTTINQPPHQDDIIDLNGSPKLWTTENPSEISDAVTWLSIPTQMHAPVYPCTTFYVPSFAYHLSMRFLVVQRVWSPHVAPCCCLTQLVWMSHQHLRGSAVVAAPHVGGYTASMAAQRALHPVGGGRWGQLVKVEGEVALKREGGQGASILGLFLKRGGVCSFQEGRSAALQGVAALQRRHFHAQTNFPISPHRCRPLKLAAPFL